MDWVKERDALIAQTVAFVQSVTGRKPDFATAPIQVVAVAIENSDPIENIGATEQALAPKPAEVRALPAVSTATSGVAQIDIRKEVQSRIAAFQAHQHRFQRDRDVYFRSVLAKTRADAENSADIPLQGRATAVQRIRDPGSAI